MINKERNLVGCIFVLTFIIIISIIIHIFKPKTTTPVEDIKVVDSLKQVNKTLIIEVEHLDSIKNAKIIEVKSIDNDSTIKLFYQLISE